MTEKIRKDPRFEKLEIKIGIMIAVAIAGIVLVVALLGIERDLFTKKFRLWFTVDSGAGFVVGMPVKLSGFKIGRVKNIELTGRADVKITLEINKKYEKWLRRGSIARFSKEGFIGESIVEITIGKTDGAALVEDDMIPFEKSRGIEDIVNEAKPILNEVKEIIHYINDPKGDLKSALGNIRKLSGDLGETSVSVGEAVNEAGLLIKKTSTLIDAVSEKGIPLLDSAASTIENVEDFSQRLGPAIDHVDAVTTKAAASVEGFSRSLENIEKITGNLRAITDTLAEDAPRIREILIEGQGVLKDTGALVKGMKKTWPFSLAMPEPKAPELIPLDGFVLRPTGAAINEGAVE
ncbi:MAG: MlaD family protein [Deltaproteobacteria bacterium]